jgi:hypothetical protein
MLWRGWNEEPIFQWHYLSRKGGDSLQALTATETQKRIRRNGRKYLDTLKSRQEFMAAWEGCTVTGTKEMQDQKLESMQRVVCIPSNVPDTMTMPQCLRFLRFTGKSSWRLCDYGAQ